MYLALTNVKVGVFGSTSVLDECTVDNPVNVPNRLSATTIPHRSAAQ